MVDNASVKFFERQFRRQVRDHEFALNPFETLALPYLRGTVLDLGCGLGNLTLEAARRGHPVVAVDASDAAIQRIRDQAACERLPVQAIRADIASWRIEGSFDTVVSIGLLMFFPRSRALELLTTLQSAVRPGGCAVVNALTEGTTYLEMFQPGQAYLFGPGELERSFREWRILLARADTFPAPASTRKAFSTVVAEKPRMV